jgi:NAD(P)-dependent dehydrogenase (short-subunit alcohol dehydrogenase family)
MEELGAKLGPVRSYWLDLGTDPRARAPDRAQRIEEADLQGISGSLAAWIHLVPAAGPRLQDGGLGESRLLVHSWKLAEQHLTPRIGASFISVVPAQGSYGAQWRVECDLASATARGLNSTSVDVWSGRGLRINSIVSGGFEGLELGGRRPESVLRQRIPMGRLGSVQELADAVNFLASRGASYVNGAVLHLDGGWMAYSWFYPVTDI